MNNPAKESEIVNELSEKIRPVFSIYDIQHADGNIFFFGVPKEDIKVIFDTLFPFFSEKGYQFTIKYDLGEHILIASPFTPQKERRWINVVLAIATIFTTMVVGSISVSYTHLTLPTIY